MTVGQARFVINRCLLHCTSGTLAEMAWCMSRSHSKAQFINVNITPNGHWRTNIFFSLLRKLCSPWSYQKWVRWVTKGENEVENVSWILQHSRQSTELAARRAEIHKEELNAPLVLEILHELKKRNRNVKHGGKGRLQKTLYLKVPIQRCTFLFRQTQQLQEVDLSLYLHMSCCPCHHFREWHFKRTLIFVGNN